MSDLGAAEAVIMPIMEATPMQVGTLLAAIEASELTSRRIVSVPLLPLIGRHAMQYADVTSASMLMRPPVDIRVQAALAAQNPDMNRYSHGSLVFRAPVVDEQRFPRDGRWGEMPSLVELRYTAYSPVPGASGNRHSNQWTERKAHIIYGSGTTEELSVLLSSDEAAISGSNSNIIGLRWLTARLSRKKTAPIKEDPVDVSSRESWVGTDEMDQLIETVQAA